jgi:multiple sugar transport system permease protein
LKKRSRIAIKKTLLSLLMILVVIVTLFPVYWLMLTSFQPRSELMHSPPLFGTRHPTIKYYQFSFREKMGEFFNSLVVAFFATLIAIVFGATSAYAFARYQVGGKNLPFWILSLKFFPPVVAIVPYFIMMKTLRLIDTRLGLIIPHLIITVPFAVWMIKGFIQEVPRELEEAAMIDGCSQLNVIRIVTLPLIAPGLVITALFCFIWSWTRSQAVTIPVAIAGMREAHGLMWGEVSSTAALGTIPIIILAIILQRYLVRGLSLGSLK